MIISAREFAKLNESNDNLQETVRFDAVSGGLSIEARGTSEILSMVYVRYVDGLAYQVLASGSIPKIAFEDATSTARAYEQRGATATELLQRFLDRLHASSKPALAG